jgi:hypothetical protein
MIKDFLDLPGKVETMSLLGWLRMLKNGRIQIHKKGMM